jgi:ribosome-binding ATPase
MSLSVGIVGLPNVGKSTLFNAILKKEQALSANYPFATIEPNVGAINVPDSRLDVLATIINEEEGVLPPKVYASIEFIDIAGLIKGASKGGGLGNQFLANIRECDMILQVVRDFKDENIIREQSLNPDNDTEIINSELIIKDLETLEKRMFSVGRDPKKQEENQVIQLYIENLGKGIYAFDLRSKLTDKQYTEVIKPLFLLTDKEVIYVFNVDENDSRLTNEASTSDTFKNKPVVYISARTEFEISALNEDEQTAYLAELGIKESGLSKISRVCFDKLGLISFLTAGVQEVRAWEITKNSTAVKAAGRIHTDFEKSFIKAEIINFNDYQTYKTKNKAKEAGKLRLEGKEYIMKDGDVVEFKIGAG